VLLVIDQHVDDLAEVERDGPGQTAARHAPPERKHVR
jgi:hypothetical protein